MKNQGFIKGSIILMVSALLSKVLGAIFKIPLTNILGGVGMSYFSCAYSIFLPIYALSVTGLSSAVARLTAQSVALGMYENAKKIRKTALLVFSAIGLVGSLLIYFTAYPFSVYIGDCPEAKLAIMVIAPSVLFGCITAVERGYYEGLCNMYPTAFSQLTEGIVKMGTGLLLCNYVLQNQEKVMSYFPKETSVLSISASAGILGVTLSSLGAMAFFPFMRAFSNKKAQQVNINKTLVSSKKIGKDLILIALPIGISAVVTNLTALIDLGTITSIIGNNPLKYYSSSSIKSDDIAHFLYGSFSGIALTVFNLVPSVTNMLGKGILPTVTKAWESNNKKMLEKSTSQALETALFISAPAGIGIGVLAEKILNFLYSGQSEEVSVSVQPLQWLMLGMVFLCISFPIFSMLQAIGKPSIPLKIMILGTFVKLISNILLVPQMGLNGASISTTICYGFILVTSLIIYIRKSQIRISFKPFVPIIYSSVFCGATAWIAETQLEKFLDSTENMLVSTFIGGLVYFAILYISKKKLF